MSDFAQNLGIKAAVWAACLLLIAIVIIVFALLWVDDTSKTYAIDVVKVAGLGLTCLFSIATFLLTFVTERSKITAAQDLEIYKTNATVAITTAQINAEKELEATKARYIAELESEKRRLEFEVGTYRAFIKAAARFYRAVEGYRSTLPEHREELLRAEGEMRQADAFSAWLTEDLTTRWYDFWQQGKNIAAALEQAPNSEQRTAIWNDSVKEFGERLKAFQSNYKVGGV